MATGEGSGGAGPFGGFIGGGIAEARSTVNELYTELGSFTKFRDRIDEILVDLKGSPADARKLGEVSIGKTEFGATEWAEATSLFASYKKVVGELETLSKVLSDSIEGMSIAVLASHKGYDNMDEDIRARMLAIKAGAESLYPKQAGAEAPVTGQSGGGPSGVPSSSGDTAGAGGFSWGQ